MTATVMDPGTATQRSRAFVAVRLETARELGRRAGDELPDAAAAVAVLHAGLADLGDPEYLDGQRRVAPGIGVLLGVRSPLLAAVTRGLRAATRHDRPDLLLDVADHLGRQEPLELHWLANDLIERAIAGEPERAWQLVRRESRSATDWITVDGLAHVAGRGILVEPYRWAELEQLVFSPSPWERRLAGSTVATIPFVDRRAGRAPEVARRGLGIVSWLLGDDKPDVQRSLSWALRSLTLVDPGAVAAFLDLEAAAAAAAGDGHRAWVIRDTLGKVPLSTASRLRSTLAGVRRRPGAPSTSRAAATAAQFLGLGVDVSPAERPTVDRSQPTVNPQESRT